MTARIVLVEGLPGVVASTPAGRPILARGGDLPIDLWVDYAALCDELIGAMSIPSITIEVPQGWTAVGQTVESWLATGSSTPNSSDRPRPHA